MIFNSWLRIIYSKSQSTTLISPNNLMHLFEVKKIKRNMIISWEKINTDIWSAKFLKCICYLIVRDKWSHYFFGSEDEVGMYFIKWWCLCFCLWLFFWIKQYVRPDHWIVEYAALMLNKKIFNIGGFYEGFYFE